MAAIEEQTTRAPGAKPEWSDYIHTGPDTLMGRYMRLHWLPVAASSDIEAGRAKPIRIMSEDFTLYRGQAPAGDAPLPTPPPQEGMEPSSGAGTPSGQAHLVAFRCAHRGTQLSTGWVEGDEIRCFYHGWKYEGTGQCTEQPAEPEPFCSRMKIRSYPVQEYLGAIWAYLGPGEPPAFPRVPQLEEESETDVQWTISGRVLPFNWVNNMENDPGHVPFVHRGTLFFADVPQIETEETDWGVRDRVVFENRVGLVHRVMPSARFFTIPQQEGGWSEFLLVLVPVDDESHMGFGFTLNHLNDREAAARFKERMIRQRGGRQASNPVAEAAASVLRGDAHCDDMLDNPNIVLIQDATSQWGQGTVRSKDDEHLGRSDAGVMLMRRVYERELRNLAEGRPLKQWRIPDRIDLAKDYHG